jgi:hypothetical protein
MNMSPPRTIATSASERASGPVNEVSRLAAARSQGDWARSDVESSPTVRRVEAMARAVRKQRGTGSGGVGVPGCSHVVLLVVRR